MRLQESSTRLCAAPTCAAHLQMSLEALGKRKPDHAFYLPPQEQAALAAELSALQIPSPV